MTAQFILPETLWPVGRLKKENLYFFENIIEASSNGRVFVKGYGELIMLSSYSYLGLVGHPDIEAAAREALERYSTGTHGVRLLAGTTPIHKQLESKLAQFKGTEDAVTFSSGYAANLSIITALVGRHDYIIGDELIHASLVDACLLSNARFKRFKHNEASDLRRVLQILPADKNKLVICDGIYSMDGAVMRLPEISEICREYGALLMVDEAHSLGVLGATGHGIEEHFGLPPDCVDIKMGTLSKTIPSVGGYACASPEIINIIKHQGRGFIYSAALPPVSAAAALEALNVIEREAWRVARLHENYTRLKGHFHAAGIDTRFSEAAVAPAICGDDDLSWELASRCVQRGLYVQGIPYPVVSKGTARLRCIATADHSIEDIDRAANIIIETFREAGVVDGGLERPRLIAAE